MRGQEGYTAPEALAALAIIGLAMAGLTTSMGLIGKGQAIARERLEQAVRERTAVQQLERILAYDAPFRSDQAQHLVGDAAGFEADCGASQKCGARLSDGNLILRDRAGGERTIALPAGATAHFAYIGAYATSAAWPPAALPPPAPGWPALSAVTLQDQNGSTLALARIWRQQRADCEYDTVIQDCRGVS